MSPVQLGSSLTRPADYGPLGDMVNAMRDSIIAEVRTAIVNQVTAAVAHALADHNPTINVAQPHITVAAPDVTVTPSFSPNVTVNVPEDDEREEVAAIAAQTDMLRQINDNLKALLVIAQKPVVTEVDRDNQSLILRTTQRR